MTEARRRLFIPIVTWRIFSARRLIISNTRKTTLIANGGHCALLLRLAINRGNRDATNKLVANGALNTISKEAAYATSQIKEKTGAFMEVCRFARMVDG